MNSALITAIASVSVAVVTVIGTVIVGARRKPPSWKETWDESRELRGDLKELRDEFEDFRYKHNRERTILGNGFDALWRSFERLRIHWGDREMPLPDVVDEAAIRAAQALRNADGGL